MDTHILNHLYDTIKDRKSGNPDQSWTAQLFADGTTKIAQKVGEEAVETALSAVLKDGRLAHESADLLYHLMVLWVDADLNPDDIFKILKQRCGTSGIEEKNNR